MVPMLDIDRVVTTSAPMMEDYSADVVQVWRYSDLKLLHTIEVPPGKRADGSPLPGAARYPFGPRRMADGSVLMNSFGCGFYRLVRHRLRSASARQRVHDPDSRAAAAGRHARGLQYP
jgi:hypothetical protein